MTLVRAVRSGDLQALRQILRDHHVDVNRPLDTGETLLHLAVGRSNAGVIQVLLDAGADVNAATTCGEVPLHLASTRGLVDVVRQLYERGARLDQPTPQSGETNLHLASRGGHVDLVDFLLQHGAGINVRSRLGQTPLTLAAAGGGAGVEVLKRLLEKGASVNGDGEEENEQPSEDRTDAPIHLALANGDVDLVRLLVEAGADVNVPDGRGSFPLHKAAELERTDIVDLLLRHGADANCKGGLMEEVRPWIGERRYSPLHVAASKGHADIVRLLLDAAGEVDMPTTDFGTQEERPWCWIVHKETALHLAADGGHTDLVRLLTQRGADLTNVDVEGNMPHHLSLHSGHHDTLHALLVRGSLINARDGDRKPALHQAIRLRDHRSTCLLLMHGASVSPRRKQQRSVMHMLAADATSDHDIFPMLYYCGNSVGCVLHQPQVELLDLKVSEERRYIYNWLCAQWGLVQPLKVLCRWLIRRHCRSITNAKSIWIFIENLPVPQPIKKFLLLAEYNRYLVDYEPCPIIQKSQKLFYSPAPMSLGFNY